MTPPIAVAADDVRAWLTLAVVAWIALAAFVLGVSAGVVLTLECLKPYPRRIRPTLHRRESTEESA
jgi:hypothetical protein